MRLHALDWNAGFCIANNVALRELRAPYVLVLNPDTEIYPGSLDHMMALMESDPSIGMSSCRLEQRDGTLDHASKRSFPTPLGSLAHSPGSATGSGPGSASTRRPSWASTFDLLVVEDDPAHRLEFFIFALRQYLPLAPCE